MPGNAEKYQRNPVIPPALVNIYRINLGVKKHENVLVFTDSINAKESVSEADRERRTRLASLALLTAETGKAFCNTRFFSYPSTGSHGAEPPPALWKLAFGQAAVKALKKNRLFSAILKKTAGDDDITRAEDIIRKQKDSAVDCAIALSNYSTSHTKFRDFLTRVCGCRYASMPLFEASMLDGAMAVDWKALAKRTKGLASLVNTADRILVTCPNGTSVSFSKRGRKALSDTGILTRKGAFGNLPAGEVFLAPVEGSASGRLVLEWAPTRQLTSPVTLTVTDGRVSDVSGTDEYAEHLSRKLSERPENCNIAELGIGTNDAARRPDNILESEKILGTIHIALGDNSAFGGTVKTPFHQDFVFFKPTVTLIDKDGSKQVILKSGNMLARD